MCSLAKTATAQDQERVQATIDELLEPYLSGRKSFNEVSLQRDLHIQYILKGLDPLPSAFVGLDANMPWIMFWLVQSHDVLAGDLPEHLQRRVINTLKECQHLEGGFGGGKGQEAHLACTYAAIAALAAVGTEEAYSIIDVAALKRYLLTMKQPNGSFTMQIGGEADCRGSYCALAASSLCGILDEIQEGSANFIASCQSYEGGLGGVPYAEAHAGYTYCGFAALSILGAERLIDLGKLADFARRSQCKLSGGFRGRTNKLVDGCYSFWTGALFPLIRRVLPDLEAFDSEGLQKYLLVCCQDPERGGLRDKPEKSVDYYHTCYCLAGLNVAQQEPGASVLGLATNALPPIDILYNLRPEKRDRMQSYFSNAHRSK